MPNHKLMSPTMTYIALPNVGEVNKGLGQTQNPVQQRDFNKLLSLPEITASHNGVQLLQNKNLQSGTSGIVHSPSGLCLERRIQTISITRKPTNTEMKNGNRTKGVSNNSRDQSRGSERRNAPSGTTPSDLPGTSTQSGSSSQSAGGRNQGTTRAASDTLDKDYVEDSDSDSSNSLDFSDIPRKKTIESLRLPYTSKEDIAIIKYVLLPGNIDRTGSLSLWRELETQMGEPKRTYQSLKNRFLRNIKPHLLTKYRRLLSSETVTRVKRKFPDLKRLKPYNTVVGEHITNRQGPAVNTTERPVGSDNRPHVENLLLQNKPLTRETERSVVPVDKTVLMDDEVIPSSQQNRKVACSPMRVTGVEELERRDTDTVSGNGSAGDVSSAAVEVFVPRKAQNLPIQSFQCTKIIKTLRDKTNLNLNIVLLNEQSSSLLSKLSGPVKVDIVVSVSSIQEKRVETENSNVLRLEKVPSPPKTVEKKQKRRRIKLQLKKNVDWKKYFLRLRKGSSKKLLNVTPEYKQSLAGLLRMIESNNREKRVTAKGDRNSIGRMILRSRTREASPEDKEDRRSLRSQASPDKLSDSEDDEDGMIQCGETQKASSGELPDSEDDEMIECSQNQEVSPEEQSDSEVDEGSPTWEDSSGELSDSEDDDEMVNSHTGDNENRMNLRSQTREVSAEDNEKRMNLRSRTRETSPVAGPSKKGEDGEDRMNLRSRTRETSPTVEPSKKKEDSEDRMNLRNRKREESPENNEDRITLRNQTRAESPGVDEPSQTSSQETNCSDENDSDYSEMYREVTKRYQVVTVDEESQSSEEWEYRKKRPKTEEKQTKSNILLKNMVGMLSPSSRVFSNQQNTSKVLSKKL